MKNQVNYILALLVILNHQLKHHISIGKLLTTVNLLIIAIEKLVRRKIELHILQYFKESLAMNF